MNIRSVLACAGELVRYRPISGIQILCRVLVSILVILLVVMLKPIESAFNLDTFPSCVLSGLRVGSQADYDREATALNSSTFFKSVIVAEDGQSCHQEVQRCKCL